MSNNPKVRRVVRAIDALVAAAHRTEQDSMGTYYEEKELEEALDDLIDSVGGSIPESEPPEDWVDLLEGS